MSDICTSLHSLITNKICGFLIWLQKPGSNLTLTNENVSSKHRRVLKEIHSTSITKDEALYLAKFFEISYQLENEPASPKQARLH